MTISSLTNRKNQTSDGVQLVFAYDYLILDEAHLILYLDDDTDNPLTGFTVTGIGNQGGGTAVFTVAPAAGTLSLVREVPFTQAFDYITGGKFPADTHERLADLAVMMIQQLKDIADRSLQLPLSSDVNDLRLPEPIAEYLLQWNATADGLNNVQLSDLNALITTTPFSESLLDDPDAATARTTLGVDDAIAAKSTFVNNANGNPNISDTLLDIDADIAVSTWESVGPTGSGADNIWTAMDGIPTDVDWIEISITHRPISVADTANTVRISVVYVRKDGSAETPSSDNTVSLVEGYTSAAGNARLASVNTVKVPVAAGVIFEAQWTNTFQTIGILAVLTGYGYN